MKVFNETQKPNTNDTRTYLELALDSAKTFNLSILD
jgi:acyl carrier protein